MDQFERIRNNEEILKGNIYGSFDIDINKSKGPWKKGKKIHSDISKKLEKVDDSKFKNGWGLVITVEGKKVGFLTYNSGGQKNLNKGESLTLGNLKNLKGQVDDTIIMHLQAFYHEKAQKVTKEELSKTDIVIITDHNVSSPEIIK